MKKLLMLLLSPAKMVMIGGFYCLAMTGCERDVEELSLATFPAIGEVYIDGFSGGLNYAAFGGSKVTAFQVDDEVSYSGSSSMRIEIPDAGDPSGAYAGGVYFTNAGRDLSGFNVLTFWAKASKAASVDLIGFGNDLGESRHQVVLRDVAMNTNWQKYYIAIPDPSKLTQERGMLYYSEGPEEGKGYTLWIDEVQFENLGTIAYVRGNILGGQDVKENVEIGYATTLATTATFNLPTGVDQSVEISSAYMDFVSSDPAVATVDGSGHVVVLGPGTTRITASLAGEEARGSLTIESSGAPVLPQQPAPSPEYAQGDVISIFSNVYDDVPVDYFNGFWEFSTTQISDEQVDGDDMKRYTELNFVGIQFTAPTIDASRMTHFHMDIWTPEEIVESSEFKVLLVDIGADGSFGGGDDSSQEIPFSSTTLRSGEWIGLDIALSDLAQLTNRTNLAQIVLSGNVSTVFVDNIFFYAEVEEEGPSEPTTAAPQPTFAAENVISLFSDAYENSTVDTWRTDWSSAVLEDVEVAGSATKKYSQLDFVGIETVSSTIDATAMTHFHIDLWSSDFTFFAVKLVDFGADGAFGGGDDVEHQIDIPMPAQGEWVSLDIPLTDFQNLVTRSNLAQYILVGQPSGAATLWVDNVYFHN